MALGTFGAQLPLEEGSAVQMSFDAHILSLRTLFRGGPDLRVQLVLDDRPFAATVVGGALTVEEGEIAGPDATITGDPGALLGVAHGRVAMEDAGLVITGDEAVARRFLTLFPLPEAV